MLPRGITTDPRFAEPEDIVDVILFLLSDQSRYICGSVVEVNGAKQVR